MLHAPVTLLVCLEVSHSLILRVSLIISARKLTLEAVLDCSKSQRAPARTPKNHAEFLRTTPLVLACAYGFLRTTASSSQPHGFAASQTSYRAVTDVVPRLAMGRQIDGYGR